MARSEENERNARADVYQKGYRIGGKVVRPAMVTVAYGGAKRPVEDKEK